jgi:hypothetical protein
MAKATLSGSLTLTKLKHVKMNGKNKAGDVIEGIFIPIVANKLVVGKPDDAGVSPIYMPFRVLYNSETDDKGQNGFLAKSVSTEDYKAAKTDDEKKALQEFQPILGSVKDFSASNAAAQDNAGSAAAGTFEPDDDLPF